MLCRDSPRRLTVFYEIRSFISCSPGPISKSAQLDVVREEMRILLARWFPRPKDARMPFQKLGLHPHLIAATRRMLYTEPTPIQADAIPAIVAGRDVIHGADRHSQDRGIPVAAAASSFRKNAGRPCLILSPTRELAQQIEDVCRDLVRRSPIRSGLIVGARRWNRPSPAWAGESRRPARARDRQHDDSAATGPAPMACTLSTFQPAHQWPVKFTRHCRSGSQSLSRRQR
jgi:hypothetical protein